jgi:hypothetical protein
MTARHAPLGIKLLAAFFAFGAAMCLLTILMLLFPGSALDSLWRLNPEADAAFHRIGTLSILLMLMVGTACALAAIGLAKRTQMGNSNRAWNFDCESDRRFVERVYASRSSDAHRTADWRGDDRLLISRATSRFESGPKKQERVT